VIEARRLAFDGNPTIGLFATCTEEWVLVPEGLGERGRSRLEGALGAPVLALTLGGSHAVGALAAGNSRGFLVASTATPGEIRRLESTGLPVHRLPGALNAAGSLILANDSAAVVSPRLGSKAVEAVERFLGVRATPGLVGGAPTVGMAAVATNAGVLASPRATERELALLERVFRLPVDVGTVNGGFPYVGSGLLANSKGYVAGAETTGHELGRVEEALGFIR
jgi:translation initiation factor 6